MVVLRDEADLAVKFPLLPVPSTRMVLKSGAVMLAPVPSLRRITGILFRLGINSFACENILEGLNAAELTCRDGNGEKLMTG